MKSRTEDGGETLPGGLWRWTRHILAKTPEIEWRIRRVTDRYILIEPTPGNPLIGARVKRRFVLLSIDDDPEEV